MREYQRLKQTKYILPRAVYHTALWRIRDYYRIKKLAEDLTNLSSPILDCMPKSNITSDSVAKAVIKREKFIISIKLIDDSLKEIPQEYRMGVWNNIQFGQAYPLDASRATYGRYKSKFIYKVAEKLNLI